MTTPTLTIPDNLVFKMHAPLPAPGAIGAAISDVASSRGLSVATLTVNLGFDDAELYAYLALRSPAQLDSDAFARAVALATGGTNIAAIRYVRLQGVPGAAHGSPTEFHYVVETDVVPEAEADLNDWYYGEHLAGLAAVPGTVRAERLRNLDGSPRYHAWYALASKETFESAPWLAVRNTAWSDRVRPNFRNTKRTMFRRVVERTF